MRLFYEKYLKLAHIGRGANAHVYKVQHAELGYVRAIKVLNDYIENKSEKTYLSFLKECKTLLAIGNGAHPNIVRIYGPDLIDNHAIVEMDYVRGTTLDSYIKDKGFVDYEEVRTFIDDIVGALAYTHHDIYQFLMNPEEDDLRPDPNDGRKYAITPEKEAELVKKYGIAHNDLHSNNVMRRDYDGRFVLLDFGLAVQDGKCIKSSRMGDGNPEYQAPEKFDFETVDPRSDVYSLGVLIYELLAGRVPFPLEYDQDGKVSQRALNKVLNRHMTETPSPILPLRKAAFERQMPGSVYERDYPEWLDEVVMKCLAKNPKDRFKDAKELKDCVTKYIKSEKPRNESQNRTSGDSTNILELRNELEEYKQKFNTERKKSSESEKLNEALKEQIGRLSRIPKRNKTLIIIPYVISIALIIILSGSWLWFKSVSNQNEYYSGAYHKLMNRLWTEYGDSVNVDANGRIFRIENIDGDTVQKYIYDSRDTQQQIIENLKQFQSSEKRTELITK